MPNAYQDGLGLWVDDGTLNVSGSLRVQLLTALFQNLLWLFFSYERYFQLDAYASSAVLIVTFIICSTLYSLAFGSLLSKKMRNAVDLKVFISRISKSWRLPNSLKPYDRVEYFICLFDVSVGIDDALHFELDKIVILCEKIHSPQFSFPDLPLPSKWPKNLCILVSVLAGKRNHVISLTLDLHSQGKCLAWGGVECGSTKTSKDLVDQGNWNVGKRISWTMPNCYKVLGAKCYQLKHQKHHLNSFLKYCKNNVKILDNVSRWLAPMKFFSFSRQLSHFRRWFSIC